jgi:two-component system, OmpR family, response regulator
MAQVILVEDNVALRKSLADFLTLSGHCVSEAGSAVELYQLLSTNSYEVAVVDINLPHHSGFSVTEFLAENRHCAVIITSVRDAVADRVQGYRAGADIYMVKPVEPEELSAAITQLAAKRLESQAVSLPERSAWSMDAPAKRLWAPNNKSLVLTPVEVAFLEILLKSPGQVHSREEIAQSLYGSADFRGRSKLDTMISRLRAKVRRDTELELPLETRLNTGLAFPAQR